MPVLGAVKRSVDRKPTNNAIVQLEPINRLFSLDIGSDLKVKTMDKNVCNDPPLQEEITS